MQEEVLFPAADGQLWDFVSGGASAQTLGTEADEAGRRAGVG